MISARVESPSEDLGALDACADAVAELASGVVGATPERTVDGARPASSGAADGSARPVGHGAGIRDGNGIMFISHTGDICPSGFLEIPTGNVRRDDVVDIYRHHTLFESLRNPAEFHGRCGPCEFRWVCGGSRARAYSASHDPLGEDPLCEHEPSVHSRSLEF